MPTYAYRCPSGHEFDRFYKRMSAAPTELPCGECGLSAARQLSGGAGLLFKGSGFYLTDYGKNAHRKPEPAKSSDAKSDSATKPDAKPESRTDAAAKSDAKAETPKPKIEKPVKPTSE